MTEHNNNGITWSNSLAPLALVFSIVAVGFSATMAGADNGHYEGYGDDGPVLEEIPVMPDSRGEADQAWEFSPETWAENRKGTDEEPQSPVEKATEYCRQNATYMKVNDLTCT